MHTYGNIHSICMYVYMRHIYIFSGMLRGGCQNYSGFSDSQWYQVPFSTVCSWKLVQEHWVQELARIYTGCFHCQMNDYSGGNGNT